MPARFFIYDPELHYLARRDELNTRKKLGSTVDFVLAVPPHNVRKNRKHYGVEFNLIKLKDMKDNARVLETILSREPCACFLRNCTS